MIDCASDRERLEQRARIVLWASREDSDLSQRELGAKLGWTRNQVANLEGGRRVIQFTDFLMIAKALSVSPLTLLQRILQW